jgi:pyridoxamine 5'-phosphate oxidase
VEQPLSDVRRDYRADTLDVTDIAIDPWEQFGRWYARAAECEAVVEPNAMVLATAASHGQPSARTVLLKAYDSTGFVFFTNYDSRKGRELAENPQASLVFPWLPLERQVIVVGRVARVSATETEEYFATRPYRSRIGAWASDQSTVVESRAVIERRFADAEARFPTEVPVPEQWGGFRVSPVTVEFWQGRRSRLHDRLRYRREADGPWSVERLSP